MNAHQYDVERLALRHEIGVPIVPRLSEIEPEDRADVRLFLMAGIDREVEAARVSREPVDRSRFRTGAIRRRVLKGRR